MRIAPHMTPYLTCTLLAASRLSCPIDHQVSGHNASRPGSSSSCLSSTSTPLSALVLVFRQHHISISLVMAPSGLLLPPYPKHGTFVHHIMQPTDPANKHLAQRIDLSVISFLACAVMTSPDLSCPPFLSHSLAHFVLRQTYINCCRLLAFRDLNAKGSSASEGVTYVGFKYSLLPVHCL